MRYLLFFLLVINGSGCSGADVKTISIYDGDKKPLPDALIIVSEQRMLPIGKNKKYILKSDESGKAKIAIRCLVNIIAGKRPFYLSGTTASPDSGAINLSLTRQYDKNNVKGVVEFVEMKTGKSIFMRQNSELWGEWKSYISYLETTGYFDSVKSKDWFVEEIR